MWCVTAHAHVCQGRGAAVLQSSRPPPLAFGAGSEPEPASHTSHQRTSCAPETASSAAIPLPSESSSSGSLARGGPVADY